MSHQRRVFLHIGTAKTGTTSLQHWLDCNRAELLKCGYLYPSIRHTGNQATNFNKAQHILAFHWGQGWAKFKPSVTEGAWQDLKCQAAETGADVILSSETFTPAIVNQSQLVFDKIADAVPGARITPIVYIREHTGLIISDAFQLIRSAGSQKHPQEQATNQARHLQTNLNSENIVRQLQTHPQVNTAVVRIFEKKRFANLSIEDDFRDILGIPPDSSFKPSAPQNSHADSNAICFLLLSVNALSMPQPMAVKQTLYEAAKDVGDTSGKFLWPEDFGQQLYDKYAGQRRFLSDLLGQDCFAHPPEFRRSAYEPGPLEDEIADQAFQRLTGQRPNSRHYKSILEELAAALQSTTNPH